MFSHTHFSLEIDSPKVSHLGLGIFRDAIPSYNLENKFLLYEKDGSRSKTSWQSVELVLWNPSFLVSPRFANPSPRGINCLNPQEDDAKFIEFSKGAEDD